MKHTGQIRLLIADDHALMRACLKHMFALVLDFVVAGEAASGHEVLACLRCCVFDVVLLDLNMPGLSGIDLITRIQAHQPQLPILVLTLHNEPMLAIRALKAGACGYITKNCEPDILQAAIRKVAARGSYIAPGLAEEMVFQVTSKAPPLPHHELTNREMEVLHQLLAGHSGQQIAQHLSISPKTVSTHKIRLMEKLNVTNTADLMRYAIAQGLSSETSEPHAGDG